MLFSLLYELWQARLFGLCCLLRHHCEFVHSLFVTMPLWLNVEKYEFGKGAVIYLRNILGKSKKCLLDTSKSSILDLIWENGPNVCSKVSLLCLVIASAFSQMVFCISYLFCDFSISVCFWICESFIKFC